SALFLANAFRFVIEYPTQAEQQTFELIGLNFHSCTTAENRRLIHVDRCFPGKPNFRFRPQAAGRLP
ncbi:MAG: hypothetical protein V5B07_12860, partial [Candidatus Accumulibacter sp. UW27]